MQILIINPERFVQYKKKIGIMLYNSDDTPKVNLFTGNQHFVIRRNEIKSPLIDDLNDKLLNDEALRDLALEHSLIEVHYQDRKSYLNYYSTYN
jgi:hypothetical protein|tara:strand:+ start:21 stop:302 length:282 start_codon:yes stop_codon:yes gene_type:complete